jgi:hypothetical protein
VERVKVLEKKLERIIPSLFPHLEGRHAGTAAPRFQEDRGPEHGAPPACRAAVATKLTGHKTETVYRRYAMRSDADLKAALRLDGYNHGDNQGAGVDAAVVRV